ncbi:hypothetical protein EYF80_008639 [Liparis tanakae]|uniref:Uncharacterized protein n=1 Tax=Liparis tanakae TaxID=230148 RepID=A0A4Z2IUT6_9TELE|nr:hypothetical protein EYF80_008639 [Liparis tanakae]
MKPPWCFILFCCPTSTAEPSATPSRDSWRRYRPGWCARSRTSLMGTS